MCLIISYLVQTNVEHKLRNLWRTIVDGLIDNDEEVAFFLKKMYLIQD